MGGNMTQKDLLYLEDAIEHEKSIIKLCNIFLKQITDNDLSLFMEEQKRIHVDMKNKLMAFLKEKANG